MWIKKSDYENLVRNSVSYESYHKYLSKEYDNLKLENQRLKSEAFRLKGLNTYEVRYNGDVSFSIVTDDIKESTKTAIIYAKGYTCRKDNCYVFYDGEVDVAEFTNVLSVEKL